MTSLRFVSGVGSLFTLAGLVAGCLGEGHEGAGDVNVSSEEATAASSVVTVDLNQRSGRLKKAGLGTLFGITTMPATPKDLSAQTQVFLSAHQQDANGAPYPSSTDNVAPTLDGTDIRMVGRLNDLVGGWPYDWKTLDAWMNRVDAAVRRMLPYKHLFFALAPFNEPDNKFQGNFMSDPAVQGGSYDERVNWLWTQVVRRIRSIDASLKIMGPNYEHYNPWEDASRQPRMRNFLINARDTGTVPDIIGWHSLGASPGDVPECLTKYFRPLENELNLPGRPKPITIEEYGPGSGDFEGVPGTMVKHWAEFERYGIDYGSMGIYTNPGLLGNTLRRTQGQGLKPNGGFYMMRWYKEMLGERAFVSRWDTRHYQSVDGVASWDAASRTATVILGGEDTDVDVKVLGVGGLGFGGSVRVRVDSTVWDKDPNEVDKTVLRGGDPKTGTYNIFDKNMTLDASGAVSVPIHRLEGYNGYRILISPAGGPDSYPTKFEAEKARLTHASVHNGADAAALASNNGYVGGIDFADSAVEFDVSAPSAGFYMMTVRYANGTGAGNATHNLTVNGEAQGDVSYTYPTAGWSNVEMRTVTKRVILKAGNNTVRLSKGAGYAEVDYIEVRPDSHRYEAEHAKVTNAHINHFGYNEFPDFVGGLDNPDSSVEFVVDAPKAGTYRLDVGYGNGTAGNATHQVFVNDGAQGAVSYVSTRAWLSSDKQDTIEKISSVSIKLNQGTNRVRLQKGDGYAELDFVTLNLP